MGKLGPSLIFDHTDRADRSGLHSIVIDDFTGGTNGVPLSEMNERRLDQASLPLATPSRGDSRGTIAFVARKLQQSLLVQIVAAEMLVDATQHGVIFEKRNYRDTPPPRLGSR